mgnify:CR=1 FL=1
MSLKGIAKETLSILDEGKFISPSGKIVNFKQEQLLAVNNTILYTPEKAKQLLDKENNNSLQIFPKIEVTDETTQVAAKRLVQEESCNDLVLLNFASARNPGGGFINGAKAQEEDISRCSGLYPCLLTQPLYYEINRRQESLLYTDHVIYSPKVPFFRSRNRELLEDFFLASVITAPAPNAGQHIRHTEDSKARWLEVEQTLKHRAGIVLAIAEENKHRTLLLGAWGCGVFGNSPAMVADVFANWLENQRFLGCFDRVVFGIYDSSQEKRTFSAFQRRFSQS